MYPPGCLRLAHERTPQMMPDAPERLPFGHIFEITAQAFQNKSLRPDCSCGIIIPSSYAFEEV